MRRRSYDINRILKRGMAFTGMLFFFMIAAKAAGLVNWQGTRAYVSGRAREPAASWVTWLWRQSYPGFQASYGESNETKGEAKDGLPWYIDMVWQQLPLYQFVVSESGYPTTVEEPDPSYAQYCASREFYQEHQYLFQYGAEDSNQQEMPELPVKPAEQPAMSLPPVDTTPAYTVGISRDVIGTQYVMEQLADYDFLMKHFYNVHSSTTAGRDLMDAKKLLSKDFTLEGTADQPQILIYHTHSQETYADYGPDQKDATVIGIGNYLTELLRAKGYNVIHDTTVYDLRGDSLDRNKAYTYALEGITSILQQNPSIEVVLDVHRDGVKEGLHMVSEVNGKPTAPIMFFNGTSQTPTGPIEYLQNPYREDNLAFSLQMQLDAAAYFPGLTRKIYLKGLRYNLHLRPRSALIEVGAQTNTYQEALNAMEPLAELLDMVLQGD